MTNSAYQRVPDEELGQQQLSIQPANSDAQCEVVLHRQGREGSQSLLHYVETALSHAPTPQFVLRLEIFVHDSVTADSSHGQRAIEVALPRPRSASIPYCRADDAPCMRGTRVPEFDPLHNHRRLSTCWSLGSHKSPSILRSSPPYHVTQPNDCVSEASSSARQQWDTRMARRLCPPWKPLGESGNEDDEQDSSSSSSAPWPAADNQTLALQSVERFLQDEDDNADRFFVCPASCYGWDMRRLEEEIKRDLNPRARSQASTSGGTATNWFHSILDSFATTKGVRAYIKPCPPALAIRVDGTRSLQSLSHVGMMYCAACFVSLVASLWFFARSGIAPALVVGVTLAAFYVWAYSYALKDYLFVAKVYDSVGVAWALKRWSRLEYGVKTSEHALSMLPDAIEARQNDDGSWSVLHGLDEVAWWQQNKSAILAAVEAIRPHRGVLFLDERLDERRSTVFPPQPSSSSTQAPPPAYDAD